MTASLAARALLAPIRFYQRFISPSLPASCRYYPTCSSYTAQAIETHGAFRGSLLGLRRLGRCHPWHEGGFDPVPPARVRAARVRGGRGGEPQSDPGSSNSVKSNPSTSTLPAIQDPAATTATAIPDSRPATAETPNPRSNAA